MGWAKTLIAVMTVAAGLAIATEASAQQTPQGRDCQTVRTCNFSRTGAVRGCLSSYTCRTCRLVPTRCDIGGVAGTCRAVRCSWGG
ncbi:MAG: hypothetical protein KGP27_07050 [Hyphomicrobiales bacterium]|nr:hypothetical protein [Hyphomicrobiales bacterium]